MSILLSLRHVYNMHSPVAAVYELRRSSRGTFSGEGRLSTAIAGVRAIDVTVPSAAASRFLSGIADAPIIAGSYAAMQYQTDDYPHIEIAIHVDVRDLGDNSGFVLLFTKSQGEFHAPWGACIGGQTFSLPGEQVGMALAGLRGPLKRKQLDRIMKS